MFEMQYPKDYRGWKSRKFKVVIEGKDVYLNDAVLKYNDTIYGSMTFYHDVLEHTFQEENYIGEIAAFGAMWRNRNFGLLTDNQYRGIPQEVLDLFISCNSRVLKRCTKHPNHDKTISRTNFENVLLYMLDKDLFLDKANSEFDYEEEYALELWNHVHAYEQSIINAYVKGFCNAEERYPGTSILPMVSSLEDTFARLQKSHTELYDGQQVILQWNTWNFESRFKVKVAFYNENTDKENTYTEYI